MKNKTKILGVIGIVLITVLSLIGCAQEAPEGKITIGNNCDEYTITRIVLWGAGGTDITETLSLAKGQSKSWTVPNNNDTWSEYTFNVSVTPEPGSGISADRLSNQSVRLLGDNAHESTQILHLVPNLSPNATTTHRLEWRSYF